MEDVNKLRRNFISLSVLGYGPKEFNSTRVRLHLTEYVGRNNCDREQKNANSLFNRRSLCRRVVESDLKSLQQPRLMQINANRPRFIVHHKRKFVEKKSPKSNRHKLSPNKIIHNLEKSLGEFIKWSPKGKFFDILSHSLSLFLKKMYGDQCGEFPGRYWGLNG